MNQNTPMDRKGERFADRLRGAVALLVAAIREIFDESAYTRFLARNRTVSSPLAYAAFRRENELAKARRPRCC
jgi:hypothetical protein